MKPKQYIKNQYLYSSFKEKIEPYLTDTEYKGEINSFVLGESLNDIEIQNKFKPTPIPIETAGSFIQKFLENADKSKWYITYVQTKDRVVAVRVAWLDGGWSLNARELDESYRWDAEDVFFSPATADTETLKSKTLGNSDPLNFEQALKIVKDAGCKVIRTKVIEEEL